MRRSPGCGDRVSLNIWRSEGSASVASLTTHGLTGNGVAAQQPNRYLCVKGKAGLGNRMLAAATAWLYAQLSGRAFVPDWCDYTYSHDGSNVFHRLFECKDSVVALPDFDETSVAPTRWISRLSETADKMVDDFDGGDHSSATLWRRYSIDLGRLDHPERYAMFWSYDAHIRRLRPHLDGAWASWRDLSDDQIIARVLRDHITLAPAIRRQVDAFAAAHFSGGVIGVHIRNTDRRTSVTASLRHLAQLRARHPAATIFLATDNRRAEELVRRRYDRVLSTAKWFPEDGAPMHQNTNCPDRLQNAVEGLIDMYLLAECDYLIFPASSTFSRIAGLISTKPRANLIDIERHRPGVRIRRFVRSLIQ
ncbi:hypothetical protein IAG41_10010 [Sphingomonas sp. JC676]|uniref:nodulation protein NodZ n=1 Tax=Sphingomonas sp. JC676 TaxID=2768065 RepID=UPI0016583841|nr:nodulation protein NodZ [Sphingomonas sp. JC676]MBC9032725.1 hypothetical protein [Sphingomonas sp. JC676]